MAALELPRDWSRWCDHIRDKTGFYIRDIRQWSDVRQIDFDGWLANFTDNTGRYIATRLLNRFIYYSERDVLRLLQHAILKVFLYPRSVDWALERGFDLTRAEQMRLVDEVIRQLRFVPLLDDDRPSESGNQLCRYLSRDFGLPKFQMSQPEDLASIVEREVIVLDDFVGSGQQAIDFWMGPKLGGRSLRDVAASNRLDVTYLCLVTTDFGLRRIATYAPGLKVMSSEILGERYRVFETPSLFFDSVRDVEAARDYLTELCRAHGIPLLGFHDLDYSVAFHHAVPDATLPLFWADTPRWHYLVKRRPSSNA